jgi:hypothetical protein
VSFITTANDYSLTGNLDKGVVDSMLRRIFPKVVQSFKIETVTSRAPTYCYRPSKVLRISPSLVIKLIQIADALNTDTTKIIDTLTDYTLDVKESTMKSAFHEFLFPVADGICEHIKTMKRSSTIGERRFIKHIGKQVSE